MPRDVQTTVLLLLFALLSVYLIVQFAVTKRRPFGCYVNYLWGFFLLFVISECFFFEIGIWVLAVLCFWALREYFSLVDFRVQDRWAILGGYAAIPFMVYFIQIRWYGMFIISIPVYGFLIIPFLVSLGGKDCRGAVFSIGAIDFGLFLIVYCLGHIGYLASIETWMAVMLILNIWVTDGLLYLLRSAKTRVPTRMALAYFCSAPLAVAISVMLSYWADVPTHHAVVMGAMTPALVIVGDWTIDYLLPDLGISADRLVPGKGLILTSIRSFFYAAPVVFHYYRYFLT